MQEHNWVLCKPGTEQVVEQASAAAGEADRWMPSEAGEFTDGVVVLREAIAGEPAKFKSTVEPLIENAVKASHAMSDATKNNNEVALSTAHDQFAAAVKSVIDAFPEDVRPMNRMSSPPKQ